MVYNGKDRQSFTATKCLDSDFKRSESLVIEIAVKVYDGKIGKFFQLQKALVIRDLKAVKSL